MLKSTTDDWNKSNWWGEYSDDVLGRDAFGFSALPAGERNSEKNFDYSGSRAVFWSATESNSQNAYIVYMEDGAKDLKYISDGNKSYSFSIRCVKD